MIDHTRKKFSFGKAGPITNIDNRYKRILLISVVFTDISMTKALFSKKNFETIIMFILGENNIQKKKS